MHAIAPSKPDSPVTLNNGVNVVISWSAPSENGSQITSYAIKIRESNGVTFTQDLTNCDGTDNTIISSTTCTIPQSTLTSAPYSLSLGDDVYARVVATNVIGSSTSSDTGSGANIITVPDAPVSLAENTA